MSKLQLTVIAASLFLFSGLALAQTEWTEVDSKDIPQLENIQVRFAYPSDFRPSGDLLVSTDGFSGVTYDSVTGEDVQIRLELTINDTGNDISGNPIFYEDTNLDPCALSIDDLKAEANAAFERRKELEEISSVFKVTSADKITVDSLCGSQVSYTEERPPSDGEGAITVHSVVSNTNYVNKRSKKPNLVLIGCYAGAYNESEAALKAYREEKLEALCGTFISKIKLLDRQ
jgi:hypothetical protein